MIFYFSGTGNSRYCAKWLAHRLGDEAVDAFPFLRDDHFPALTSRSPWVFVSPTYGWQLPRIFEALLRGGRFSGSRDAYFVMTCGAEIGDPIPRLEALCRDMGLTYRGVLPVVMPENYIALFRAPGPEEARAIVAAAVPGLEEGAERIRRGESLPPVRRGAIDKLKSGPVNAFFYRFIIKAGPFRSTSACVGCGSKTPRLSIRSVAKIAGPAVLLSTMVRAPSGLRPQVSALSITAQLRHPSASRSPYCSTRSCITRLLCTSAPV